MRWLLDVCQASNWVLFSRLSQCSKPLRCLLQLPAEMHITLLTVTIRPLPVFYTRSLRCSAARVSQETTTQRADDERYMRLALQQAQAAFDADEVPIGAILVSNSVVLSTGRNMTETQQNPLAHAELQCIMSAAERLQAWRLQDATLYCTVEPCPMCAGAILQARLQRLVYGARQPRLGADGSWVALFPEQSTGGDANIQRGHCRQAPVESSSLPPAAALTSAVVTTTGPQCTAELAAQTATINTSAAGEPIKPIGKHPFHNTITVTRGVLEEECRGLMVRFFQQRRQEQRAVKEATAAATALALAMVQGAHRICPAPQAPTMSKDLKEASQSNESLPGLDAALSAYLAAGCVGHILSHLACNRTMMPACPDPGGGGGGV